MATAFGGTGQYDQGVFRNAGTPTGGEPLVPTPVSAQILQELPAQSVMLTQARHVTMSALTQRQPVLSVLPQAYFLNAGSTPGGGDFALKKTTKQRWENVSLVAEELAVIVPIPLAYLADAQVDVWGEIRPRLVEAFGIAIDAACLFGVNKPSTWSDDIFTAATAAGNVVAQTTVGTGSTGPDLGVGVSKLGLELSKQGYSVDGFVVAPGFAWSLAGYRNEQGNPIYQRDLSQGPRGGNLYGYSAPEAKNGSFDATKASVIGGEWENAILGLRQDITFSIHTDGVIQDNTGAIVLNLMQEDSVALRAVMRVGYATANPVTALTSAKARTAYYPFAILDPAADLS